MDNLLYLCYNINIHHYFIYPKVGEAMKKIGLVTEVNNDHAVVSVSRKSACEGCHANVDGNCSACITFSNKEAVCKADNSIGACVGDRVEIETESKTLLFYAAAVFLFPVILAIIGYFLLSLTNSEPLSYLGALGGFVIAFFIVWLTLGRSASRPLDVKIVRIL